MSIATASRELTTALYLLLALILLPRAALRRDHIALMLGLLAGVLGFGGVALLAHPFAEVVEMVEATSITADLIIVSLAWAIFQSHHEGPLRGTDEGKRFIVLGSLAFAITGLSRFFMGHLHGNLELSGTT